jgi:hypothetical protein
MAAEIGADEFMSGGRVQLIVIWNELVVDSSCVSCAAAVQL